MISERLPQLAAMTREEKWQLLHELEEELHGDSAEADDPQMHDPETKAAIAELLTARMAEYKAHPETARPGNEVRASIQQRFEAWKSDRRHTA